MTDKPLKLPTKEDRCYRCNERMVGQHDITGDARDYEGYMWCPKCAPHDGIPRTYAQHIAVHKAIRRIKEEVNAW